MHRASRGGGRGQRRQDPLFQARARIGLGHGLEQTGHVGQLGPQTDSPGIGAQASLELHLAGGIKLTIDFGVDKFDNADVDHVRPSLPPRGRRAMPGGR